MCDATHVFIAEDHPVVRYGLRMLLEAMPGVSVVGETGDGSEVVDRVLQLDPDIVLLDISLPNRTGIEILATLRQKRVRARILIVSMHTDERYVLDALHCGASGYMLKSSVLEELKLAISSVREGYRYLSTPLSSRAIDAYVSWTQETGKEAGKEAGKETGKEESPPVQPRAPASDKLELDQELTSRQREVLLLMAEGYGNSQIGHRLGISPRTAEIHRAHVMRRLNLSSQTEVVLYAVRHGLISVVEP